MHTQKTIDLHEKCIKILDMIHEQKRRVEDIRCQLYTYDNSPDPYHVVKLFNTREKLATRLADNRVILTRLVTYYDSTMLKMLDGVLQRRLIVKNENGNLHF